MAFNVAATLEQDHTIKFSNPSFELGYWGTMYQPVVTFVTSCPNLVLTNEQISNLVRIRQKLFGELASDDLLIGKIFQHSLIQYLTLIAMDVLLNLNMPIISGARAIKLKEHNKFLVGLPAIDSSIYAPIDAFRFSVDLINDLYATDIEKVDTHIKKLSNLKLLHKPSAPSGINTPRFIFAAHDLKIPWMHIVGNVYQFGWGKNSRLLDSSFTDKTSNIGSKLARHKYHCATLLSRAGVPVPKHFMVRQERDLAHIVDQIGFPLVVKPENLDGGVGVLVGLENFDDLLLAYRAISKLSSNVLVEKYIEGQDYRLQVFQDKVYWVAHRRPARVCGDGKKTILELIDEINISRGTLNNHNDEMTEFGSEIISIDSELNLWLKKQSLTLESIPFLGQEVRLRGAANVSQGGTRQGVHLSRVHQDNIDLAIKAVRLLRLDLAGVDMLIPDISKSYKDVGGYICEVNAQPQLSSHLPTELIKNLVPNHGRIPIVMLCGFNLSRQQIEKLVGALNRLQIVLGWAKSEEHCRQLLLDPEIGCLVWSTDKIPDKFSIWPCDSIDLLVIKNEKLNEGNLKEGSYQFWPSAKSRANKIVIFDNQSNSLEDLILNEVDSGLGRLC